MESARKKRVDVINEILKQTLSTKNANQEHLEPLKVGWRHILSSRGWS